jgi:hypothetical protein
VAEKDCRGVVDQPLLDPKSTRVHADG